MNERRQAVGKWGENLAEKYLCAQGAELLDRNVRTPFGELDLIVRLGRVVIFVEVKARTSDAYGYPEEAVTAKKQIRLSEAAQDYISSHTEIGDEWRIDVIAIRGRPGSAEAEIEWFQDAVS